MKLVFSSGTIDFKRLDRENRIRKLRTDDDVLPVSSRTFAVHGVVPEVDDERLHRVARFRIPELEIDGLHVARVAQAVVKGQLDFAGLGQNRITFLNRNKICY